MAKAKSSPAGGSAAKKHPADFTHVAVTLRNPADIMRWVASALSSAGRSV